MLATVRLRFLTLTLFVLAAASSALAQTQYFIGNPTPEQQYMLELINRARANADAEAIRLGIGSRQEGPPTINGQVWQIQNTTQPLSWSPLLFNAAQTHAKLLNDDDEFFIPGSSPHFHGGTNPNQRIAAAGYSMAPYSGPTNGGFFPGLENVAEAVSFGSGPYTGAKLIAEVLSAHNDLFTDLTVPGRGHRSTTTLAFWREIGIGISVGTDVGQDSGGTTRTWESLYIVQNFGAQSNTPFITGVVYQDTNGNGFYDPGEGIGGIRVDVAGSNFFAVTTPSGGYSVPVPGNGSYTVTFSGNSITTTQKPANVASLLNAKVDLVAPNAATPTFLANVSSRLAVGAGDNALFGGFFISAGPAKRVIVRALGPSIGLPGQQLENPTLQIFDGQTQIGFNDDWKNQPAADRQAVQDALPPTNDLESALVMTLPPNSSGYTAVVRGANNTTGIGVVEVYDLDKPPVSRLVNVSARGVVQTGNDILIGGTILLGQTSQKVGIRALGPSLPLSGKLANPTLELRDAQGALVQANDNWRAGGQEKEIIARGLAPTNELEPVIVSTLTANRASYTAIVRGLNNTT
ncbi:MAG TPA: hypothetical protein VF626_09195, partial [Chthoniobacterales bacterium]